MFYQIKYSSWLSSFMVNFINLLKTSDTAGKFLSDNFLSFSLKQFKVFVFQISLVHSEIQIS